ncbi:MAG: hypothetical protein LBM66_04630 [Bifidobacteriaceae bacterium]|nr:hypothetical protein [Bifidobacteriaceae bacterium]
MVTLDAPLPKRWAAGCCIRRTGAKNVERGGDDAREGLGCEEEASARELLSDDAVASEIDDWTELGLETMRDLNAREVA